MQQRTESVTPLNLWISRLSSLLLGLFSATWYSALLALLIVGWLLRDKNYIVAESGIGYWLGIIGGSMMLLLLIYPLRKRFNSWSAIGSVKAWFRIHMILGLLGPLLVIYHSGYELGSFNSTVAFFCMLIVAGSGLLGRYLYRRIHQGLYGRKIQFEDLYTESELLGKSSDIDPELVDDIEAIEQSMSHRHTGENRSLIFFLRTRKNIARLKKRVANSDFPRYEKKQIDQRLKVLHSICRLGINEILFSYWHVLHLPLFIMLVITGCVHVVMVHLY